MTGRGATVASLALLIASSSAAADRTEVTLFTGVSFLDATHEEERSVDVATLLPPGVPRELLPSLPTIQVRERRSLGSSPLLGFAIGRRVTSRAWLEAEFALAPAHRLEGTGSASCPIPPLCALVRDGRGLTAEAEENVVAYHYGWGLGYELLRGDVRPFLVVGVGGVSYDAPAGTESAFTFKVGAGARLDLGSRAVARIEVADHVITDHFVTGGTEHDVQVRAGMAFKLP